MEKNEKFGMISHEKVSDRDQLLCLQHGKKLLFIKQLDTEYLIFLIFDLELAPYAAFKMNTPIHVVSFNDTIGDNS
jgi:hypothetical protein